MKLFRTGEALANQFSDHLLITHRELDGSSKEIVRKMQNQVKLSTAGVVGYPALHSLTGFPTQPVIPLVGCFGVHVAITKHAQNLLLHRLSKNRISPKISFEEIKKRYTHMLVDLDGNVLLVKEPKKGFMARYLSNFYLARVPITDPEFTKSKTFQLMRKVQRKFWPGKVQRERWKAKLYKE